MDDLLILAKEVLRVGEIFLQELETWEAFTSIPEEGSMILCETRDVFRSSMFDLNAFIGGLEAFQNNDLRGLTNALNGTLVKRGLLPPSAIVPESNIYRYR